MASSTAASTSASSIKRPLAVVQLLVLGHVGAELVLRGLVHL